MGMKRGAKLVVGWGAIALGGAGLAIAVSRPQFAGEGRIVKGPTGAYSVNVLELVDRNPLSGSSGAKLVRFELTDSKSEAVVRRVDVTDASVDFYPDVGRAVQWSKDGRSVTLVSSCSVTVLQVR